jgi:type I restriction enzyme S subunit
MTFGLAQHNIDNLIAVLEQNPKVDKALVFGSRAMGNYRPDSDIDITIKGQDLNTDDIIAMSVAFEEKGITHKIDLINYQSINEPDLKDHIDRVGIELYSRWKEYKFSELLIDNSISYGIVQPGSHSEINSVPIIRVNNIKNGYIKTDEVLKVSSSIEENYTRTRLVGGELLITVVGSVGECAIVPDNLKGWNVARAVSVARIKKEFDKKFIKYAFKTGDIIFQLYGSTNDTVQPTLNLSSLKDLKFKVPSLPQQSAIASILSSLDDKIDLLHRQNKTLEQLAETLFRQWFVEEAKESWEVVNLGQFVKTNQRNISKDYVFTEIEYLDTSSLTEGIVNETQNLFLKNAPSRAKRLVQNNDILISTVRPDQKHYGIINNPKKYLVASTGFCVITCIDINPYFVYLLLTNDEMTQYLHSIAEGSTSTYPSLKPSDIEKIEFQNPPESKMEEFGKIAADCWTKIYTNQTQIRTLTQTRDTLLPKLMSGEVRV